MEAIVYTSNTGTTKEYAQILGKQIDLPVYSLEEALSKVKKGSEIIYLGWLMASGIKGYKKAAKQFDIKLVCGVGMGATGSQIEEVRKKNGIEQSKPLFTLTGGFYIDHLHGMSKFMMKIMVMTAGKALEKKTNRTEEEEKELDLMMHGGSRVSLENLRDVLEWYHRREELKDMTFVI